LRQPVLTINSNPAGATVYVDDGEVGLTPVQIENLSDGTHTVRLTKDQYGEFEKKVFIQQRKAVSLNVNLILEPFGNVKVTSEPSGATVLRNGQEMGTTPVTLIHLAKGDQQITLQKKGHESWEAKVEIIPLQPASVHGVLTSVYGSLQIISTPNSARVFIDKWEVGTTPYYSDRVLTGKLDIELHSSGYEGWKSVVEVSLESPVVLNVDLASVVGSLAILSMPMGADVYLDGENIGQTPIIQEGVKKGNHKIELKHKDCVPWTTKITLQAVQENELSADLKTVYGNLNISSNPSGAKIFLDGKKAGQTPYRLKNIPKGQHKLELKLEGFDKWKKNVNIVSGKEQKVEGKLVNSYGSIEVNTTPSGAVVLLNGKEFGRTPLSRKKIQKGRYHLELKLQGHDTWRSEIQIIEGRKKRLEQELVSLYGSLKITTTPTNATVFIDGRKSGTTPFQLDEILNGRYALNLQHDGYDTWHENIMVNVGKRKSLVRNLIEEGLTKKIIGNWSGRVRQNLFKVSDVKVKIAANSYQISYPSLDCGGQLILLSQTAEHIEFRENITYGGCYDGGNVIITKSIKDTIKCQWLNREGRDRYDSFLKKER